MDLSAYAELAVRLANAASDEEEACGAEHGHHISTLDGLRRMLTDLQFPDIPVTRNDLDAMRALRIEFRKIFAAAAEGKIQSVRMVTRKPVRGLAGAPYLAEHNIRIEDITTPVRISTHLSCAFTLSNPWTPNWP